MAIEQPVRIPQGGATVVHGNLAVPDQARGLVVFAHGSGSGRHSPRNRMVAARLRDRGLATLLMDLLTADEEQVDLRTGHLRFDIGLLADRLAAAAGWLAEQPLTLVAHLHNERHALFSFLRHYGTDATNWRGEQAIRPAVVNRKVWAANRTRRGADTQGRIMSVLRTAAQQGIDGVDWLARFARAPDLAVVPLFIPR